MNTVKQTTWQLWCAKYPLYDTWRGMIRRCEDPTARSYEYYGGKGITVCSEWHDYGIFRTWILGNLGPRPDGMTLDRINSWGNYEPGNVRWATWAEQYRNRRRPWWDFPEFAEHRPRKTPRKSRLTIPQPPNRSSSRLMTRRWIAGLT